MSLGSTIKAIQDIMRKDAGVDGDAQRIGQLAWMLFLKIYSDLELETELEDSRYKSPTPKKLRWESWADEESLGKDALTGDALINFINNELFPMLKELDLTPFGGQARERGALLISVFDDAYNYMKNGTLLRQVINKINQDIDYNSVETRHLFGDIYEQILKDLQNAGNAGEFYTPRAVTQFAIDMVNPQLGEIVLDPACGTGGFLTGAFEHMKKQVKKPAELKTLKNSIRGVEKKPLPHVLCATNMMVHGIEVPSNILNDNTLARPLRDYGEKDQVDVIVTNPPYLANHSSKRKGVDQLVAKYFDGSSQKNLYRIALEKALESAEYVVAIIPETFLLSTFSKNRLELAVVIQDSLFGDTDAPALVACFTKESCADAHIFTGNQFIGNLSEILALRESTAPKHSIVFNDPNGRIGLRAVDGSDGKTPIAFVAARDFGYPSNSVAVSSRLMTYLEVPGVADEDIPELISKANGMLASIRMRSGDLVLAPFKGNNKAGKRRRRLDYALARRILNKCI